jgi:thiamine-monophosphate kinase
MTNSSSKPGEFDLIAKYFAPLAADAVGAYGLKDDAACIAPPQGEEFIITTDLLSGGTHFFADDPPDLISRKALRVNLSDLAAKGAKPVGYLLSLALPGDTSSTWVESFARGLREDQRTFEISLFGGDTIATTGPATVSITAFGTLPFGTMTLRNGAKPGDIVFVTGTIGDAAAGLSFLKTQSNESFSKDANALIGRYHLPQPRVAIGQKLRGIANSALDISDGLIGDMQHIADTSSVQIVLYADRIPVSVHLQSLFANNQSSLISAVTGGDDYEIAFTTPSSSGDLIQRLAEETQTPVTEIGKVQNGEGIVLMDGGGLEIPIARKGYKHF